MYIYIYEACGPFQLLLLLLSKSHLLHGVPIENVVVGEPLTMEQVSYELPKVRIIRLLLEPQ